MLTDTHAHLDFPDFAGDIDAVLQRASDAGVKRIITIATGLESSRRALALADKYPHVYAAVGVHPCNVLEEDDNFLPELRKLAAHPKAVAIGEAGLDHHHHIRPDPALTDPQTIARYEERQRHFFHQQLELAVELQKNIIIHQRDAWDSTLDILRPFHGKTRGVFHCFVNTLDQAKQLIEHGHLVSFTGILTFKTAATVRDTLTGLPADTFMFETDCPYLAPAPHRGKRAEPAHTRLIADHAAHLRQTPARDLCDTVERTVNTFFQL